MHNQNLINELTAHLFRENSGKMTAILSRIFGISKIDIILDIVQDTFETALQKWRFSGIPNNPSAWLMKVAKNKAINCLKSENKNRTFPIDQLDKFTSYFENEFETLLSSEELIDSQLRLLFTCCHPDLSIKNQVIITLHILCGFGIPEIANALIMNTEAVKKALTRSKSILRMSDFSVSTLRFYQSDQRIKLVQTILYLMFNEGYKTTRGKRAINNDLCYEAIRLAKLLGNSHSPLNHETNALIALMFFNISRFPARLSANDEWITLEEQDRSRWDQIFIKEGYYYLNEAIQTERVSRFYIEAIISSIHCSAQTFEETNWQKIDFLYGQLVLIEPSPMVAFNKIIAESYLSTANSIKSLDDLEISNKFLIFAAKGDVYRRIGEIKNAEEFYKKAFLLTDSALDKNFLQKKIAQCKTK